jgi:ankyrin repeat protein
MITLVLNLLPFRKDCFMGREELDRAGRSALHYAIVDKKSDEAARLIRAGADINRQDKKGWTPLHFAAQEQTLEIARLLLEAGARVDEKDSNGNTPLSNAVYCYSGNGELIRLLREWGADPCLKNNHGVSPLDLARSIGNTNVAQCFDDRK